MIFILSNHYDTIVNEVIDYLDLHKVKFKRITDLSVLNYHYSNSTIRINDFDLDLVEKFWYRKGGFRVALDQDLTLSKEIKDYLNLELEILNNILYEKLNSKTIIGNIFQRVPNKLIHLDIANKCGLNTPQTLITNQKEGLIEFLNLHKNLINKSIKDSINIISDGHFYFNYTERITNDLVNTLNQNFFPSLFQEEIKKKFELRVVFIHSKVWAYALFSQDDKLSQLDWRNINPLNKPRIIPFNLPNHVKKKILKFSNKAGLNCGVIDMIHSINNDYVFLECNPNGQLNDFYQYCNFNISQEIFNLITDCKYENV